MSKVNDILAEVLARAGAITGVLTSVKRARAFHESELPGVSVYRDTTETLEASPTGEKRVNVPVIVEYHKAGATEDPAAEAESMVEAVIASVEEDADRYIITDGIGLLCEQILAAEDETEIPDDAGGVIIARVSFQAIFTRHYGLT